MRHTWIISVVVISLFTQEALADVPLGTAFSYQGQLKTLSGPANGAHDLRFVLYNAATAGSLVAGPICLDNVGVDDGLFTATLDFGASAFDGDALWLAIEVRADATPGNCAGGVYTPLSPRQALTATPYALGLKLPFDGGASVQSGAPLRVTNTFPGPLFTAYGIWGEAVHPAGRGVYGLNPNTSFGGSGVYGESRSSTGFGTFGFASATSGANYGVFGRSDSTTGSGVFGRATALGGENFGVQGVSASQNGHGVHGLATNLSGTTYGVYGRSDSPDGAGVFGFSEENTGVSGSSVTGTGVLGTALSLDALSYGIAGQCVSLTGRGVYGVALNAGSNYGVFGQAYGNASYGVWSAGRFGASGTKSFRIDHPLDPENKYLNHYCTEAPEPLNAYSGTARLDENGQAWVVLPDYFAQINRDPRVLLTAAGTPMPNLHASVEVVGNRFKIAGGAPAGKVYWRVEAARHDRWVQSHGAPEEVEKTAHERGKYQHPELYGQPAERGINYRPPQPTFTHSDSLEE